MKHGHVSLPIVLDRGVNHAFVLLRVDLVSKEQPLDAKYGVDSDYKTKI
jgi:hypothetical protein